MNSGEKSILYLFCPLHVSESVHWKPAFGHSGSVTARLRCGRLVRCPSGSRSRAFSWSETVNTGLYALLSRSTASRTNNEDLKNTYIRHRSEYAFAEVQMRRMTGLFLAGRDIFLTCKPLYSSFSANFPLLLPQSSSFLSFFLFFPPQPSSDRGNNKLGGVSRCMRSFLFAADCPVLLIARNPPLPFLFLLL